MFEVLYVVSELLGREDRRASSCDILTVELGLSSPLCNHFVLNISQFKSPTASGSETVRRKVLRRDTHNGNNDGEEHIWRP